ncbi:hypothetical protein L9F63_011353 [Diploptera punctata]|uniref:Platelet-derived growth factor (PDGF) family profile domain-containing protein n=1 Tax=Diploptera punctata TaxID=6984 RepID=A0AAD8ENY6_DIPPU|nr:hypothetical protein L9F63_011353 [Diploptera punctata]
MKILLILFSLLCTSVQGDYEKCILECEDTADPHKFTEHDDNVCQTKENRDKIDKAHKMFGCEKEPVRSLVKLKGNDYNVKFTPSIVEVNRCRGACSPGLNCVPAEKSMKEFDVRRLENGIMTCGKVEVEEHISCRCECSPKTCNDKQKFENCECICLNEDEIPECEMSDKHEWSSTDCECKCMDSVQCGSMHMWDSKECKCVLKEENDVKR